MVAIGAKLVLEFGFWALSWGPGGENAILLRGLSYAYANDIDRNLPEDARLLAIGTAILGIVVMLAFYTLWGLAEIASLKPAPLP